MSTTSACKDDDPMLKRLQKRARDVPGPSENAIDWVRIESGVFAALDRPSARPRQASFPGPVIRAIVDWRPTPAIAWGFAALVVCALAGSWFTFQNSGASARILRVSGDVQCRTLGTSAAAIPGRMLSRGMSFSTAGRSLLVAQTDPGSYIALSPASEMTITALSRHVEEVALSRGMVSAQLRKVADRSFAVLTANAVCTALGTVFQVHAGVAENGGARTDLFVVRGAVRIRGRGRASVYRVVNAGQAVAMVGDSLGQPVFQPREIPADTSIDSLALRGMGLGAAENVPGLISITSDPPGARVRVNGENAGATPLNLQRTAGAYAIAVTMDGYRVWSKSFTLNWRETQFVHALLEPVGPGFAGRLAPSMTDTNAAAPKAGDSVAVVSPPVAKPADSAVRDSAIRRMPSRPLGWDAWVVNGNGRRTKGRVDLSVLELPCQPQDNPWRSDELRKIEEFISATTDLKASHQRPIISCAGICRDFDTWVKQANKRGYAPARPLAGPELESNALDLLADAAACLVDKKEGDYLARIKQTCADYLRLKFGLPGMPRDTAWSLAVSRRFETAPWQKQYLDEAESSFKTAAGAARPSAKDLRGIWRCLRGMQIMERPILLCEAGGLPLEIADDNMRMLRTYVNNGGFIYFTNATEYGVCQGVRDVITTIIQERLDDSAGTRLYNRLSRNDRRVSGFVFDKPQPVIFHPWTFFPMVLPQPADVEITILNRGGAVVFTDTLRRLPDGAYLQRRNGYRWNAVDNFNNEAPSGYYIYRAEAGLCRTTWPLRVSLLRYLKPGRHPIFSAAFPLSDIPSMHQSQPDDLPYMQRGVFGASINGRLSICYAEGYGELMILRDQRVKDLRHDAILRWMANVVVTALGKGSLVRGAEEPGVMPPK
jgi:hypothetical protein